MSAETAVEPLPVSSVNTSALSASALGDLAAEALDGDCVTAAHLDYAADFDRRLLVYLNSAPGRMTRGRARHNFRVAPALREVLPVPYAEARRIIRALVWHRVANAKECPHPLAFAP